MGKILYYGSSTQIHSGACQWMYRLATGMRERDYDTVAVLPEKEGIAEWYEGSEVEVRYQNSDPIRRRRTILGQLWYLVTVLVSTVRLSLILRRENVDVIHVNEVRYLQGLLAGKLGGVNTVCHVRVCFESYWLRKIFGGITYLFSDLVICVSERTREQMFDDVGYDSDRVRVIRDGLPSPERFDTLPDRHEFRNAFDIDEGAFLVVCISKLIHNKGQDRVLDVAERFRNRDIVFAIVGGRVDGHDSYAREIESRGETLDNVRVTGFYEELEEVLGAADVLIHLPRHDDPFPGVVLEGMMCGLPVIGSRSGGIPEQIDKGESGFLVPKTGGEKLIVDRIQMLSEDEETRKSIGEEARSRTKSRFDPDDYFDAIDAEYRSLFGP